MLDPLKKITDLGPLVGPGWDEDAGRTIRLVSALMLLFRKGEGEGKVYSAVD